MSILKRTTTKECPVCKCNTIVSEEIEKDGFTKGYRQHCNGGMWEHRRFSCGYRVGYVPNFNKDIVSIKCENEPERLERISRGLVAKERLIDFINSMDMPDSEKDDIVSILNFDDKNGRWW